MMRIDYARARDVFELMLARYQARKHPYDNLENDLPQSLVLPDIQNDPLRLSLHLFNACHYMRGTVISSYAFRILNELQAEAPWLFQPEVVAFVPVKEVSAVLGKKIAWQQVQVGRLWRDNARVLNREWAGDPRNIFKGVRSRRDLYRRVMGSKYRDARNGGNSHEGFGGFQEKMTSMLAYFLESLGLILPTSLSAPIDFHHFRVYLATGMIRLAEESVRYERVKPYGITLAQRLQREFDLTQVTYGDIVWLWSLRMCRRAPYNISAEVGNKNGPKRREPIVVRWTPGQLAAYERSCGRCYIADHCHYGIPAGIYYTTGVFRKIPRGLPPQGALFTATELPYELPHSNRVIDEFQARFDLAA